VPLAPTPWRPATVALLAVTAACVVVVAVGAAWHGAVTVALATPVGWAACLAALRAVAQDVRAERDRTEALGRAQVEQARAQSDANAVKAEFLTNMSHEIRTPMNAVIGLADILGSTELPRDAGEHVALLRSSARHLLEVLDSVLDFSKIDAGRVALESRPFALADVLGQGVRALAVRVRPGVEVVVDVAPELVRTVRGDEGRLRQIVDNLLFNAIKFTEDGEIVVSAVLESETDAEVEVHFTVRDTGAGIPKDRQRAIFEAFTQADGSVSRRYGGTGLGLSIASRLVQLMHGQIWVESVQGLGSSFHFTARFGREVGSLRTLALEGRVVVLVDDHAPTREAVAALLTAEGARVLPCVDGGHARAVLSGEPHVHLALIDARLGGTDGLDLAAEICDSTYSDGRVPTVMLLPVHARSSDVEQCRLVGAAGWLYKPIVHKELVALALEVLAGRADAEEPTPAGERKPSRRLRVLAAEDNLVNQHLLKTLLAQRGHQLVLVADGREALDRAQEPFDVILMDVQMPTLDGLQATRAIRSRERRTGGHVPIVAMTAHAMEGDRQRCLDAGMDAYLSKPLRVEDLYRAIEGFGARQVPATPPIDAAEAMQRVHGNSQLHAELVELFRQEAPRALSSLRDAALDGRLSDVERGAHALKTSTAVIGAVRARDACGRVEDAGRAGDPERVASGMASLEAAMAELLPALPEVRACAS
jgi:two-component system sensor histidine kinase/response regulator